MRKTAILVGLLFALSLALAGPVLAAPVHVFTFDGTTLDPNWNASAGGTATTYQDDAIIIDVDSTAENSSGGISSDFRLVGDFDVQVEFAEISGWTPGAASGHVDWAKFGVIASGNYYHMVRISNEWQQPAKPQVLWYWQSSDGGRTEVVSSATSGTFRLTRTGSSLRCRYDFGSGWQDLTTRSVSTAPATLYASVYNQGAYRTFSTRFDNVQVNSGTFEDPLLPVIPEPGPLGLLAVCLGALLWVRWRRP
ncbi:hypothetical protein ACFL59_06215 [Planctomycetota bacterium]